MTVMNWFLIFSDFFESLLKFRWDHFVQINLIYEQIIIHESPELLKSTLTFGEFALKSINDS